MTSDPIDIEQVLSTVRGDLGIEELGSIYDGNIERWINDAVAQVDACDFYIKKPVILTIENNRARLPKGFRQLLSLRFKQNAVLQISETETQSTVSCHEILYMNKAFASSCECDLPVDSVDYLQTAEIVGDCIVFHNLPESIEEIEMAYMGVPVNNECLYFIPSDYERACSAYACMRFHAAYPEVKTPQMAMVLMDRANKEWVAQKKQLKYRAAKRNFDNNKYIIKQYYKAWFVNQNRYWN